MPQIELDQKTYDAIRVLADRAELSEADTVRALYQWVHDFYKGLNGSIGTDLQAVVRRLDKEKGEKP